MKSESLKSEIKTFLKLGYSPWFNMTTVIVLAIILFIWYNWISTEFFLSYDTEDYYFTWWTYFGKMDMEVRTPLYPVFIGPLSDIFGMKPGEVISLCLQKIIRIISLFYLWRSCRLTGLKDRLSFWLITIWVLIPYFLYCDYDSRILTESLNISLTIFYAWGALQFIASPAKRFGFWLSFWAFCMVLLRPANLIVIPVTFAYYAIVCWKLKAARKVAKVGLISLVGFCALVLGYQQYTYHKHGAGVWTSISSYNNYFLLKEAGLVKPEYMSNPEMKANAEKYLQTGDVRYIREVERIGYADFPYFIAYRSMVKNAISNEPEKLLPALSKRFYLQLSSPMIWAGETINHPTILKLIPKLWMVYLVLIIYLWISVSRYRNNHNREDAFDGIFLSLFALLVVLVNCVGAMDQWGRLNINMLFIAYIAVAQILQSIATRWPVAKCFTD